MLFYNMYYRYLLIGYLKKNIRKLIVIVIPPKLKLLLSYLKKIIIKIIPLGNVEAKFTVCMGKVIFLFYAKLLC